MLPRRNVLILGASASIGGAVVDRFLERGDQVVGTYNRKPLAARNGMVPVQADLTSATGRDHLVAAPALGAPIDVLVSLVGILPGKALGGYDDELVDLVMDVNFSAVAKTVRGFLPKMADRSVILLLGSVSGERGSFDPIYAASKGALAAFAKSLAAWSEGRVRINVVSPSLIENSTMYEDMAAERRAHHARMNPDGELVQPADLAGIIFDLTLPHWKHVNGAVIRVNGGSYL
ncbi:NAD(P)-dependent dehydrogenase (short-subunit alcohol dehydrogenase family) [Amorphus suaedae]